MVVGSCASLISQATLYVLSNTAGGLFVLNKCTICYRTPENGIYKRTHGGICRPTSAANFEEMRQGEEHILFNKNWFCEMTTFR